MKIDRRDGRIVVDAAELAPLLALEPAEFQRQMRAGQISTMSEEGQGADQGRFRVTFRSAEWRLRLTCAPDGTVLSHIRTAQTPGAALRRQDESPR
ncbi:hypothetical protein FNJ84_15635 [Paracoccus sp. M683]|nr:DUF6522 family protein [uncultured Paracoccus sp.]TRW95424.1 hypothetical protein FNJ84_15635 [Paracoccus sp. M683]